MHLKMLVAHGNAVPFKALTHKLVERKMHAPVVGALAPHTQGILHVACVVGADPDERRRVFQDPIVRLCRLDESGKTLSVVQP